MKIENVNLIVSGEKYRGEVLIVDFGMGEFDIKENSYYVISNGGEIMEVK